MMTVYGVGVSGARVAMSFYVALDGETGLYSLGQLDITSTCGAGLAHFVHLS